MRAPRCCRTGKPLRRVRGGSGACGRSVLAGLVVGDLKALRVAESTSRRTFDNALRALEPSGEPVWPRFIPTVRHRSEAPLVTLALETEPPPAIFARDFHGSPEWFLAPLRGAPPVGKAREIASPSPAARRAAISLPSFRGRWRHQPDFPPLAPRVHKGPITQAASSRTDFRAQVRPDELWVCRAGAKERMSAFIWGSFFVGNVRIRIRDRSPLIELSPGIQSIEIKKCVEYQGIASDRHAAVHGIVGK